MDRAPADELPSDVATAGRPAVPAPRQGDLPFRRPPVQLPEPDPSPAPGTTGSIWFGSRDQAEGAAGQTVTVLTNGRPESGDLAVRPGQHGWSEASNGAGYGRRDSGGRHGRGEAGAGRKHRDEPAGSSAHARPADPPGPRRSRFVTVGMAVLGAVVVLTGTLVGIVYFTGDSKSLDVLRLGAGATRPRTVTAPLGTRSTAAFELRAGASSVHLSIAELGDDLYRISTPADAGMRPSPVIQGDTVQLQVTRDGDGTGGEIQVVLAAKVRWQLRFSGYADEQVLDLSSGQVSGVEMVAGTRRAELDLPKASGTVPVRITGAVDRLTLRSPGGCPVRVKVGGGASTVVAGSRTLRDVRAGATLTPRDWAAQNRYDVTTASAVGSLSVENLLE